MVKPTEELLETIRAGTAGPETLQLAAAQGPIDGLRIVEAALDTGTGRNQALAAALLGELDLLEGLDRGRARQLAERLLAKSEPEDLDQALQALARFVAWPDARIVAALKVEDELVRRGAFGAALIANGIDDALYLSIIERYDAGEFEPSEAGIAVAVAAARADQD